MGPTVVVGVALSVLAFLIAGALWYQIFGMALSFWVGLAAGGFTFKYFWDKDKAELQRILNPPDEVWTVPLPIAWGCICDVLRRSGVETGTSGRSAWTIMQEDESRGIIQAKLVFSQALGVGQNMKTVPREIYLTALLTAEAEATKVHFEYQILSPDGAGMVRELITKNQSDFKQYVELNRLK